jgi:D-serine deaminase-like pyridoxal phosphate-dependent protein
VISLQPGKGEVRRQAIAQAVDRAGRTRDRDGAPTKAFEPSLFVWATVMSRPTEDRAIVDAGLKALGFDSGPPLVCDEPAATYERVGRARPSRPPPTGSGSATKSGRSLAIATRPSTSTTGMSACAATASSSSGRPLPAARRIDSCESVYFGNECLTRSDPGKVR